MAEIEFRKKILADPDRTTTIQKLLDENAQLLKVLVENMQVKGKATECIQYQQTLHKNLVKLSYLAQPTLDVHTSIPPPPGLPPASSASQGGVSSATPTSGGGESGSKPVSSSGGSSSTSNSNSSSSMGPTHNPDPRATPPKVGLVKNYSGSSSWPPGDPYASMPPGMPPRSSMGGPAGGHMGPVGSYPPMGGLSGDHQLRLHQEQMIQAQQARRMQQQAAVGGGMYGMPPPQGPGMMGPPMSHPPQGSGMPSGYSQPTAPPGKSTSSRQQPSKMH